MRPLLDDGNVALVRERAAYAKKSPYPPSELFPEWPGSVLGDEDNPAYRAVRSALAALGMDKRNFNTPDWNPLHALVKPGDDVVLKPNFVSHRNLLHPVRGDTDCLITHGSVIRAALDYVAKALHGSGTITIADCPIQSTDWDALLRVVGLPQIIADARERFPTLGFDVVDCRLAVAVVRSGGAVDRVQRRGVDATEVDLGPASLLVPITRHDVDFGVTHYGRRRMRGAHTPTRHAYLIGNRFLECDVLLNLPKLKSHQKAGITCALKNLVGINAHKDYLPHFRFGSPQTGGDEFSDGNWFWKLIWWMRHHEWEHERGIQKRLWALIAGGSKQLLPYLSGMPRAATSTGGGGWSGNDTLWRTVLDINRAFFYYDAASGTIGEAMNARRYLAIVDGLIGGDHESPLFPSRVESGLVLAGRNPMAVDFVASACMGFDWERIPQLARAVEPMRLPLASFGAADIRVHSAEGIRTLSEMDGGAFVAFVPSRGFLGHVEGEARLSAVV
ncbi:MAG: hypothetical protein JWM95_4243 [Gemmatimonadetes bacterium]|nr:hypothetical protein [Gemmatimonadota bacterium]